MSDLLNDELNLNLLDFMCSGIGVEVNISELSKTLKKHRNTIKNRLNELFEHNIINKPIYPFLWLYKEFPLFVVTRADLPRDKLTNRFIEEDEHIFAAFFHKEEEYNTLLVEYHKDIHSYQMWRDNLVKDGKIPSRETRYPSDALLFSNKMIVKYDPSSSIDVLEKNFREKHHTEIEGYAIDEFSFDILKLLLNGKGIRTNENFLAKKLNVHRKTIERRIAILLKEKIVGYPTCRFPKFIVPPDYILVFSLLELKKQNDSILKIMHDDPHIPLIIKAGTGRYNVFLASNFYKIRNHLKWQEDYDQRFPDSFGAIKNIYLSPGMTFSIDQQYVSLMIIKNRKKRLHGRKLVDMMKT